ncbi:MAG: hypothetical protein JWO62_2611 [Acidimicrobiaceae bacterium]|nr:hypothetical protein [Acidimicrobiaceae bacterium]
MPSTEPDLDLVSEAIEILRELTDEWDHATTTRHDPTRKPIPERIIIDAFPGLIASARRGAEAVELLRQHREAVERGVHLADPESHAWIVGRDALLDASSSATTGEGAAPGHVRYLLDRLRAATLQLDRYPWSGRSLTPRPRSAATKPDWRWRSTRLKR